MVIQKVVATVLVLVGLQLIIMVMLCMIYTQPSPGAGMTGAGNSGTGVGIADNYCNHQNQCLLLLLQEPRIAHMRLGLKGGSHEEGQGVLGWLILELHHLDMCAEELMQHSHVDIQPKGLP